MKGVAAVAPPAKTPSGTERNPAGGQADFGALLDKAVDTVNSAELRADAVTRGYLTGEVEDLHQVMIAVREAELTMQLALEVRNKVVEAYQEIARIQV